MTATLSERASTGVKGLDFILRGGLPRGQAYLLQGGPGTGKTTLALQFLLAGQLAGERTLFITLTQSAQDLHLIARAHGWSLTNLQIYEITHRNLVERLATQQTVVHSADVDLPEMMTTLQAVIQAHQPDRIVFDSIGVIRALASELKSRYLEEIALLLALVHEQAATALFVDEIPRLDDDIAFQALAHGVIELAQERWVYGADSRWLYVRKLRGIHFLTGQHNYTIRTGGLEVFPRLQKPSGVGAPVDQMLSSGVPALDTLLGGGLAAGTACLIVGQAGTGKTTLAMTYLHAALQRGESAAFFLFDERTEIFLWRSTALGLDLQPFLQQGQLHLQNIDTGELTPGEFSQRVRQVVERGVYVLAIDSLTGYFLAMQDQTQLAGQMHDLLDYLGRSGVLSLLVHALHGLPGMEPRSSLDISYLADTIILLRNFEVPGAVRRALTVVTQRFGMHEQTIRDFTISAAGLVLGEPVDHLIGVLTGTPTLLALPATPRGSHAE